MAELFRKILSPVYFDETSPAALEYARHFARQNDGTVYLLHVVPTDELHLLRKLLVPCCLFVNHQKGLTVHSLPSKDKIFSLFLRLSK